MTTAKRITDVQDLIIVWKHLHKEDVSGEELEGWVKYLPAGYEYVLPRDIVDWLWHKDVSIVPDDLQGERSAAIVEGRSLHCMHIARVRANTLGYSSMAAYITERVYGLHYAVYMKWIISDGDEFFTTSPTSYDMYHFYYNHEANGILQDILRDEPDYNHRMTGNNPTQLRYVLKKWEHGEWSTYDPENQKLLQYACELIEYFYAIHDRGKILDSLDYYRTSVNEWIPGTIVVPNELREAVNLLLDGGITKCANERFIRNYYRAAEDHILRKLHDNISRRVLQRKNSSCILL